MRRWAAAVGLVVLAGCHEEGRLRVTNQGAAFVDIVVDYLIVVDDDECGTREIWRTERFTLPPGGQERYVFPSEEMDVRITRSIDGLLLFAAYYTPSDFERDHGTIEISVFP